MRVTEKVRKQIVEAIKKDGNGTFMPSLYDEAMKHLFKKKPEELLVKKTQEVKMAIVEFQGKKYLSCLVDTEDNKRVWTFQELYQSEGYYGVVCIKGKWRGFLVE